MLLLLLLFFLSALRLIMLSISRHSKHSTASIGIAYTFQLEWIRDALDFNEYETLFSSLYFFRCEMNCVTQSKYYHGRK